MSWSRRLLLALTLAGAGCFNTSEPACSFVCGPGGACPSDYTCLPDGYCHLHGQPGGCGFSDLSVPDSSVAEMSLPIDLGVDLSVADLSDLASVDALTDGPPTEPDATPGCFDGIQNGSETDVDCGGACALKCALAKKCAAGADCASTFCSAIGHVCVAGACMDQVRDNAETDTDCGGGACAPCATGKMCAGLSSGSRDCLSGNCSSVSHLCVASACADQVLDNSETDVDCGGGACPTCGNGKICAMGARDCTSSFCVGLVCVDQCHNGVQDGTESDVDCGGACATKCAVNKKCTGGGDCVSTLCSATGKVCVASQCQDQIQDGAETDVDCGGGACPTCALAKGCSQGARDCASTFCVGSVCVDACHNGVQDGSETDIDCGGSCATKCALNKKCSSGGDCVSTLCSATGKLCVASQCQDQIQNGAETDVDCGGGSCPACATGKMCSSLANGARDCASTFCSSTGHLCVATACQDQVRDNAETDLDCGGGACPTCATGKVCGAPSDCASGFCNATCVSCVPATNCVSPPANVCADAHTLTVYPNPGACTAPLGSCTYTSAPQSCPNGCFSGACNGSAPSFAADATATSPGGTVTLDKELNLNPSIGAAPAGSMVVVTITTRGNNGYQSLTLDWTNNNFATTTPVTMTLASQSGGVDTWTASIPGQVVGTTVRFYVQATKWDSSSDFNPGSNVNYTYVTAALTINVAGGLGTVSSTPSALNCSQGNTGTCTSAFATGSTVQLNTSAGFKSWGAGPCSGAPTTTPCSFTFTSTVTQNVSFYSALNVSAGGNATVGDHFEQDPASITVEGWFTLQTPVAANGTRVAAVAKSDPFAGTPKGYQLGYVSDGTNYHPQFAIATIGFSSFVNLSCSGGTIALNTTHHLAGSQDSINGMRLYVDGVLACTNSNPFQPDASGQPIFANGTLIVGSRAGDASQFAGTIDELRISNQQMYSSNFTPPKHAVSGGASTVGLYHFDEGLGTLAADSSGHGFGLTLSATNAGFTGELQ